MQPASTQDKKFQRLAESGGVFSVIAPMSAPCGQCQCIEAPGYAPGVWLGIKCFVCAGP